MVDSPRPDADVHVTDVRALRALAHPLRNRLLGLLRLDGPSTATQLGERVGRSSGSTSYHLRQLAAYGFVEELEGHGTGRHPAAEGGWTGSEAAYARPRSSVPRSRGSRGPAPAGGAPATG